MPVSLSAEEILEKIPEEALPCEKYIPIAKVDDFKCVGQLETFLLKKFSSYDQEGYLEFVSGLLDTVRSEDFESIDFYLTDGLRHILYIVYKQEEGYCIEYAMIQPIMN